MSQNQSQRIAAGHSVAAQKLYALLQSVSGNRLLSAQHNYIGVGARYTELIEEATGKRPLVWGSDFSFAVDSQDTVGKHYHCGPINVSDPGEPEPTITGLSVADARERLIQCAMEQHRRGHIVTLMWHACFPGKGDRAPYEAVWQNGNLPPEEIWLELTTAGTALHEAWLKHIDHIAGYLKRLHDADIPVLWRPYHEMNGVWFWWCDKPGPNGFAKLWRAMHERYTRFHKLDNLLWVWNANAPRDIPGDEAYAYERYYPGGDVVDVLAADVYRNDYKQSHHDELNRLADGRPIALGEVGEVPTPEILDREPGWTWFMPWGCIAFWGANKQKLKQLYADPRIMCLGD